MFSWYRRWRRRRYLRDGLVPEPADDLVDVAVAEVRADPEADVLDAPFWNDFMELGPAAWSAWRAALTALVALQGGQGLLRMLLPWQPSPYTTLALQGPADPVTTLCVAPVDVDLPPGRRKLIQVVIAQTHLFGFLEERQTARIASHHGRHNPVQRRRVVRRQYETYVP